MFARRAGNPRAAAGGDAPGGPLRPGRAGDLGNAGTCTPPRGLGIGLAVVTGLVLARPCPALAQNAATIPVSVQVLEVPGLSGGGSAGAPGDWLAEASVAWVGTLPGRSVAVGGGLAAVVTETIEPDRIRARLEYVGN